MIKAVLFDYGGVMTTGGKAVLSSRLAKLLEVSDDEARDLLGLSWDDYMRGQISEDTFWDRIENASEVIVPREYRAIWDNWDELKPMPEMLELVEKLKVRGLRIGLVSNVFPHSAIEIRAHGGYDGFHFTVLSGEVGAAKPQTEIYEMALDKLSDIVPSEIIFIDDQDRFLEPAKQLGIHTVLAHNPQQIALDITAIIEAEALN